MSEEFKIKLKQLNDLKTKHSQIEQEIYNLTESIYKDYKCRYLRICEHCGQDGMDTIWECDCFKREITYINDCNILKCVGCEVVKRTGGIINE